ALPDRVRLALVGHRLPVPQAVGVLFDDPGARVLGGAVLDHVEELRVVLVEYAYDRALEERRLAEARRHDPDPGKRVVRHRRRRESLLPDDRPRLVLAKHAYLHPVVLDHPPEYPLVERPPELGP